MSKKLLNLNPLVKVNLHKYKNDWKKEREKSENDDNIEDKIDIKR
jgi:hypothetical protein